ncbi:MAG: PIG-L family deacetylase, partial [Candidatus Latescibacteria bacterium]|nr:PIG-L family deacetylase [Candidatus Latescibacterota bacterium]
MTTLCIRILCAIFVASFVMIGKVYPVYAQSSSVQNIDSDKPRQIRSADLLKTDIMFVGAHPDDESSMTGALASETIDGGARGALVFATRGEGGGNAIGKQLGPSLGALREAEVRRAASFYGVELVYFLDKTDFFYTMSARAAFDVWGHDDSLARLVRLVRLLQPEIIVTMWPGPGTHGMHQAAARLATEAFSAAA